MTIVKETRVRDSETNGHSTLGWVVKEDVQLRPKIGEVRHVGRTY